MQKRPWEISDLLAARDGELRDADVQVDGADARVMLDEMNALQAELKSLPDVPVDESLWLTRIPPPRRSAWLRFPLATAATVFFASALGIFVLAGGFSPDQPSPSFAGASQVDPGGLRLAGLMNQSRDLEMRLADPNARGTQGVQIAAQQSVPRQTAVSATERRLLYRLADVDAQIARLYEADAVDLNARIQLWRQRVNLLESIVATRAGGSPPVSEDIRSM